MLRKTKPIQRTDSDSNLTDDVPIESFILVVISDAEGCNPAVCVIQSIHERLGD